MRTTVTLDDDVAAAVQRLRAERGLGVSEAVNALVRAGLALNSRTPTFRRRSVGLGLKVDVTNVAEALELLQDKERGATTSEAALSRPADPPSGHQRTG